MVSASAPSASGGVVSTARLDPDFFHQTSTGLGVGCWCSDGPDSLSTARFDTRVVCIQMRPVDGTIWANRRLAFHGRLAAGAWQVHAPGDEFWASTRSGYELVRLVIAERAVEHMLDALGLGGGSAALEFPDPGQEPSAFLLTAATKLKAALADGLPCSRLRAERLATGLLSRLIARHSNLAGTPSLRRPPASPGLTHWQVRRVRDLLADRLADDLPLAELAATVGLSPYHFARAFKGSTGLPPHRYRMTLRVNQAKHLLAASALSVTGIAHACGFASSQHMATVFRRLVGVTPSAWRERARR